MPSEIIGRCETNFVFGATTLLAGERFRVFHFMLSKKIYYYLMRTERKWERWGYEG